MREKQEGKGMGKKTNNYVGKPKEQSDGMKQQSKGTKQQVIVFSRAMGK